MEGGRHLIKGDIITIVDLEITPPKTYHLKLDIVFEDEDMAVINKPAGLSVSGNQFKTVQNALMFNLTDSKKIDALPWPLPVHRLDNQTSGLLIIAKTKSSRVKLGQMFEQKNIQKTYHALAIGETKRNGEIETIIDGKQAVSQYKKLSSCDSLKNKRLSLLALSPLTGRTHQLRIHCASIKHPILGDKLYGNEGMILKFKGLFLAAVELSFTHPTTNLSCHFKIETPFKFLKRMENESRRFLSKKEHS